MEKEVTFKNHEKENLKGYLHSADNKNYKSGIVLAHCFTCSRHIKLLKEMYDYLSDKLILFVSSTKA